MVYKLQLLKYPYEVYFEQGSNNLEILNFWEIIYFIFDDKFRNYSGTFI